MSKIGKYGSVFLLTAVSKRAGLKRKKATKRVRNFGTKAGLWALAVVLILVTFGCGRDRVNPVDPNYGGTEKLNSPSNVRAVGDIGRIVLTWNAVESTELAGYGVWRSNSATEAYIRLGGEVVDSLITTARNTYLDTLLGSDATGVYYYKVNTIDIQKRSSELSVFVSAEAQEDKRPPSSPTGLSAVTDVGTGDIVLVWTSPQADTGGKVLTGLTSYRVFRSKDTQDAFVEIATVSAGQTMVSDTSNLEINARYFYRVSALDGIGNESTRSGSASITTTGTGVATPNGLRTIGKIRQIDLHWTSVSEPNLIGYLVLRSTSTQEKFLPVTMDTLFTTAQTEYLDMSVEPERVYFYRVQSVVNDPERGTVWSDMSAYVDGKASKDQSPPAPPSDLIVSLNENLIGVIDLDWSAPLSDSNGDELTGLKTYRIFRSEGTTNSFVQISEISVEKTSYQDQDTKLLTLYFYTVSAVDSLENISSRASVISVITPGLLVPRGINAFPQIGAILVSWTANTESNLVGYKLVRSEKSTGPFILLPGDEGASFTTSQITYVDSPLVAEKTFFYRLLAVGNGGLESDTSTFVTGTVLKAELAVPTNVVAIGGIQQIRVSWMESKDRDLTGYEVFRFDNPSQEKENKRFETLVNTYVDSPLIASENFVYRVQALGIGGIKSQLSRYVSAEVPQDNSSPAAPGDFSAILKSARTINLQWSAPKTDQGGGDLTGLSGFRIYRAVGNSAAGFQVFKNLDGVQRGIEDGDLEYLTTYLYRISAVDDNGNESVLSSIISLMTSSSGTSIDVPTNLTATITTKFTDGGSQTIVRLTWNHPAEFSNFMIQRGEAGSSSSISFSTMELGQPNSPYDDSTVEAGKVYIYRVLTNLSGQLSEPSNEAVIMVPQ